MSFSESSTLLADVNGIANFGFDELAPGAEALTHFTFGGQPVFRRRFAGITTAVALTPLMLAAEFTDIVRIVAVRVNNNVMSTSVTGGSNSTAFFVTRVNNITGDFEFRHNSVGISRPYDITVDYTKPVGSLHNLRLVRDSNGVASFVREELSPSTETRTSYSWNGSPVFRQSFSGSFTSANTLLTAGQWSEVVQIVRFNGNGNIAESFTAAGTSNDFFGLKMSTDVFVRGLSGFAATPFEITIDYTKPAAAVTSEGLVLLSDSNGVPSFVLDELRPGVETVTDQTFEGRTVYRQRFTGTTTATNGNTSPLITGVTGVSVRRFLLDNEITATRTGTGTNNNRWAVEWDPSTTDLTVYSQIGYNSQPYDLIFEYTKP